MRYDHIIRSGTRLDGEQFHLSCGFYETTCFLFEAYGFAADIHNKGEVRIYTPDGRRRLCTLRAKPMDSGRGCYMDILICTTENGVLFRFPEYDWIDRYPHCDGESDRWDARITGIRDEIPYPTA